MRQQQYRTFLSVALTVVLILAAVPPVIGTTTSSTKTESATLSTESVQSTTTIQYQRDPVTVANLTVASVTDTLGNDEMYVEVGIDTSPSSDVYQNTTVTVYNQTDNSLVVESTIESTVGSVQFGEENFNDGQTYDVVVRAATDSDRSQDLRQYRVARTYQDGANNTLADATELQATPTLDASGLNGVVNGDIEHQQGESLDLNATASTSGLTPSLTLTATGNTSQTLSTSGTATLNLSDISNYTLNLTATDTYGRTYYAAEDRIRVYESERFWASKQRWERKYDQTNDYHYRSAVQALEADRYATAIDRLVVVSDALGERRGTLFVNASDGRTLDTGSVYQMDAYVITEEGERLGLGSEWRLKEVISERGASSGDELDQITLTRYDYYADAPDLPTQSSALVDLQASVDRWESIRFDFPRNAISTLVSGFRDQPRSMFFGLSGFVDGVGNRALWGLAHSIPLIGDTAAHTDAAVNESATTAMRTYNNNSDTFETYINDRVSTETVNKSTLRTVEVRFAHDDEVVKTVYWTAQVDSEGNYINSKVVNDSQRAPDDRLTVDGMLAHNFATELRLFWRQFVVSNDGITADYERRMTSQYGVDLTNSTLDPEP